jgi:thioesterase domain-containing protein
VSPVFALGTHYRHLVSDLKSDRPVFGLQPLPKDGKHRIPRTVESIAAEYIIQVRRVQPHGPYFLAGHSFGGQVSFEIAQQLVREGECVSFLGIIDTILHNVPAWVQEAMRLGRKVRHVHGFQEPLFRGLRYLLDRGLSCMRYTRNLVLDLWFRLGGSIPYKYWRTYYDWLRFRAGRAYAYKPYVGHITIFSSAGNSARQRASWEPLARGGLTVLEVPAAHNDMVLPPHSKLLAGHFDACLDATVRHSIPAARGTPP